MVVKRLVGVLRRNEVYLLQGGVVVKRRMEVLRRSAVYLLQEALDDSTDGFMKGYEG